MYQTRHGNFGMDLRWRHPGPIVHVRQGDTVEFTLKNRGMMPHLMDFHCAQVNPKTAFRSVAHGESVSFSFTPRYAGAFLYHCGTSPILMHLGSGMFGAIIVDPAVPLPPAREFVLVQSEFYLNEPKNGIATSSYSKMLSAAPDIVAFNGRPSQYHEAPMFLSHCRRPVRNCLPGVSSGKRASRHTNVRRSFRRRHGV